MDISPTSDVTSPDSRTIVAVFEGPAAERNRVAVPDFIRVLDGIQRSLFVVGQELMGRRRTRGPIPQTYQEQLTLELLPTEPGSFKATLRLPEPPSPQLIDFGEDALDTVLAGIEAEMKESAAPVLSEQARAVVHETILRALSPQTRLTLRGGRHGHVIVISQEDIVRSGVLVPQSFPRGRTQLVGRLLEVDFKDRTAEVWDASGKMTRVRFSEEMAEALKAAARMQVVLEGDAEVDDQGRTRTFEIQNITTLDVSDDFWKNPSLEELARQQGVRPIQSVRDFAAPSLADEDTDSLLAELHSLRYS